MKITYDNIEFDSQEEVEFYCWCKELQAEHMIESFVYHPEPFVLSERKTTRNIINGKSKESFLLGKHEYTPDFVLTIKSEHKDYFFVKAELEIHKTFLDWIKRDDVKLYKDDKYYIWIDIKGSFNKYGGDRGFSINQKWVYDKFGIYVNKVLTNDKKIKGRITTKSIFRKTFVPHAIARGKRGDILSRFKGLQIGLVPF